MVLAGEGGTKQHFCTSGVEIKCKHLDDSVEEFPSVSDHNDSCKTLLLRVWSIDQQHW